MVTINDSLFTLNEDHVRLSFDGEAFQLEGLAEGPDTVILPELYEPHPPMLFVMTSLHCKGQIFGLCVQGLDDPDTLELDDYFVNWTDAVSSAVSMEAVSSGGSTDAVSCTASSAGTA